MPQYHSIELDLGQHTLILPGDGSMEVLVRASDGIDWLDFGISLDREETYRLFISLQEQFRGEQPDHREA